MDWLFATRPSWGLTMLRVVVGVVFLAHGAQKALGWFGGPGWDGAVAMFVGMGIPAPLGVLVILAEFLGGLGLVLGALTRIAALGIAVDMLGAIAIVHAPNGFFMNWNGTQAGEGFEFHLLAIAALACLVVEGAGAFSVDEALAHAPERREVRV